MTAKEYLIKRGIFEEDSSRSEHKLFQFDELIFIMEGYAASKLRTEEEVRERLDDKQSQMNNSHSLYETAEIRGGINTLKWFLKE